MILILIDVQYSQKAVISFQKDSNGQNQSFSGFQHLVEKSPPPPQKNSDFTHTGGGGGIFPPPPTFNAIWKTLHIVSSFGTT